MRHWRVTKYDPVHRDTSGAFRADDWTAFGDIGRVFAGVVLTPADYEEMESRYVDAAIHFAHEAGVRSLIAVGVEEKSPKERTPSVELSEGAPIDLQRAPHVIRAILRDEVWCKLEARPLFYLHFGYDYYMYVGCQRDLPDSVEFAIKSGLFVEDFLSPYLTWD